MLAKAKMLGEEQEKHVDWSHISLVVQSILRFFSDKEILALCLVNKAWNLEGKRLLKARGKVVPTIGQTAVKESPLPAAFEETNVPSQIEHSFKLTPPKNANACEDLIEFAHVLKEMRFVPFPGLNMNISIRHSGSCPDSDSVESAVRFVSSRVPVRVLSFGVVDSKDMEDLAEYEQLPICQAFLTFKRVQSFEFPRLQILKFDYSGILPESELPLLKKIVQKAPVLEEFHFDSVVCSHVLYLEEESMLENLTHQVLEGTKAVLVRNQEPFRVPDPTKNYASRLALLNIDYSVYVRYDSTKFGLAAGILKNSQKTLVKASIYFLSLACVIRDRLIFSRLQNMTLLLNITHHDYPELTTILFCPATWLNCFPALRVLAVEKALMYPSEQLAAQMLGWLQNLQVFSSTQLADGRRGIEELEIFSPCSPHDDPDLVLDRHDALVLAHLCPHLRRVSFFGETWMTCRNLRTLLPYFQTVKELLLNLFDASNMDPLFCGLYPEEVKELERQNLDYLKTVHIVPPFPSIASLKDLERLTLSVDGDVSRRFLFSRVTAGICFSRLPHLLVELRTYSSVPHGPTAAQAEFLDIMRDFPGTKRKTVNYYYAEEQEEPPAQPHDPAGP